MGPPALGALPTLQQAAQDPEKEVRDAALYAAKQIQQKKKASSS
jgi:hypothetical protein